MESNSRNLRELETVQLNDTITTILGSLDTVSVGCLDDFIYIWYPPPPIQEP